MWRLLAAACALGACQLADADILTFALEAPNDQVDEFRDLAAHFGPSLPIDGFKGLVVEAQPANACTPIEPPPIQDGFPARWIALIRRYDCNFEEKIRNAQAANYSAAIVYNVNSTDLEPMSAKNPAGIHIVSVFVGEYTGLTIRDNFLYSDGYYVVINDDFPFDINTHLLLPFAIVVGICFVIMIGFMVVKCIQDRRRSRRHRLPSASLRKIPTAKFAKGDPYETCAICLEDYLEGEKLRLLPCAHAYHTKCIDPWLTGNRRVCPVCKRKVFAADEERVSDTDSDSDVDDTAPLVRSATGPRTQGGTFCLQAENPFNAASRNMDSSSTSSSSLSSTGGEASGGGGRAPRRTSIAGPSSAHIDISVVDNEHSINSCPEQYLTRHRLDDASTVDEMAVDAGQPINPVVTVAVMPERSAPQRKQDLVI